MVYRSDIEGLRAFAVVAIVLFHAGYGIYPAGFIGVDIFFVISGFLIASGIRQSIEAGQFKLLAFYKRRLWRIQPLLFSLMIVAAFFEYHYAGAGDLNAFADSLKSLSLFESNQYFGSLDFGYFADDTSIMPLLHTWSLSMEWKWYFFLPLLLLLFVNNIGKRLLPW
ncbi:MAG: acyltransferase, partial [Deferribacteraceae bacterium]|nr:acyltransferase [Deferribacteraceae bacterium]